MDRHKHFESTLPSGYVLVKHVDAKNSGKITAVYTALSVVPLLVLFPLLCLIAYYGSGYDLFARRASDGGLIALLIACGALLLYIILHELVHGVTYYIFTGAKLTFGLTLTVAFCGVPDIYVRKRASAASLLIPFILFTPLFLGLTVGLWFLSPLYGILAGAVLALHLGGCVGDLHWTLLYLTKFRRCNTLMRDTGPEQWLYIPQEEAEQYGIAPVAAEHSPPGGEA